MFGPEYPKINTLFERDDRKVIVPEKYAQPEFEYLERVKWAWTEKVDGTSEMG